MLFKGRMTSGTPFGLDSEVNVFSIEEDVTDFEIIQRLSEYNHVRIEHLDNGCVLFVGEPDEVYYVSGYSEVASSRTSSDKFKGSQVFLAWALALVLAFTSSTQTFAALSGSMVDDTQLLTNLSDIQFKTPSGAVTMSPVLAKVTSKNYVTHAYTFDDPRPLTKKAGLNATGFDAKVNQEMVSGILLFPELYSVSQVQQQTGLNISEMELTEAVQLSLWRQSALAYTDYQIQEASIASSTVRSLSTAIDTWAADKIRSKPANATMITYLLPQPNPTLNAAQASKQIKGDEVWFGPYVINSNPRMELAASAPNGKVVDTTGGERQSIITGETFYVVFPNTFSGSALIQFSGSAPKYVLTMSQHRVWLHREYKDVMVEFNVSTVIGSNGTANIQIMDSLTNMPIEGVQLDISLGASVITTLLTDIQGKATYQLPIGDYQLTVRAPSGYMAIDQLPVKIAFIGDIQTMNVTLNRSEGILNFFAVDASTLGSAGYAEAYIYQDGSPIKRLAFNNGECQGIALPGGEYTAVIYKSSGNYSLSNVVTFMAIAGEMVSVNIPLTDNTAKTKISVSDTRGKQYWKMSFYQQGKFLFALSTNGSVTLPLQMGSYEVIAQTEDNSYKLPAFDFVASAHDSDVVIQAETGTETVTFKVVDTIESEPIPAVILAVFDDAHVLLEYKTCDSDGVVSFDGLMKNYVYYVNVVAAPSEVSGYSANGNKFIGRTTSFTLPLYSEAEISEVTNVDTIYRIPNVTYYGTYVYPIAPVPAPIATSSP